MARNSYTSMFSDAELYYVPRYLNKQEADALEQEVNDSDKFRRQTLYFKDYVNPGKVKSVPAWRESYWYGDYPQATQNTKSGIPTDFTDNYPFTPLVSALRERLEREFDVCFNACLVGKFISPNDKIGFHSDKCPGLGNNPYVGSISLGKSREFLMKHTQTGEITKFILKHGDLILMRDKSNTRYLHAVSKDRMCSPKRYRINLTFRNYNYDDIERRAGTTTSGGGLK